MRRPAFAAVLLFAIPSLSLAADAAPPAPPSPPPVSYDVWGFLWNGQQYVKQDTHSFSTFDINKAQGYADQLNGYAGWSATTNIPESAVVHKVYQGPGVTNVRPGAFPTPLTYSVWAYKLTDGKWAKDASYSWTTQDPQLGLDYAQKVSAVPGWTATTNCPATVPAAQRYVDGGTVHGATRYTNRYANRYSRSRAPGFSFSPDGQTLYVPWFNMAIRIPPGTHWNVHSNGSDFDDSSNQIQESIDQQNQINDSINLQNQIATQDMINQQQMNNNLQDMINTQNFINTENDINNQQNAINAQPLVNP